MFARTTKARAVISQNFKRFNSSHHEPQPNKSIEINLTKIFGIAGLAGAALVYKNKDNRQKPLIETKLYKEQDDRYNLRNENYLKRYKSSFIKEFMKDKGGVGQRQYRRISEGVVPTSLIPAHSPFGEQFGAGIKTDQLGPRKERVRLYAPLPASE